MAPVPPPSSQALCPTVFPEAQPHPATLSAWDTPRPLYPLPAPPLPAPAARATAWSQLLSGCTVSLHGLSSVRFCVPSTGLEHSSTAEGPKAKTTGTFTISYKNTGCKGVECAGRANMGAPGGGRAPAEQWWMWELRLLAVSSCSLSRHRPVSWYLPGASGGAPRRLGMWSGNWARCLSSAALSLSLCFLDFFLDLLRDELPWDLLGWAQSVSRGRPSRVVGAGAATSL